MIGSCSYGFKQELKLTMSSFGKLSRQSLVFRLRSRRLCNPAIELHQAYHQNVRHQSPERPSGNILFVEENIFCFTSSCVNKDYISGVPVALFTLGLWLAWQLRKEEWPKNSKHFNQESKPFHKALTSNPSPITIKSSSSPNPKILVKLSLNDVNKVSREYSGVTFHLNTVFIDCVARDLHQPTKLTYNTKSTVIITNSILQSILTHHIKTTTTTH